MLLAGSTTLQGTPAGPPAASRVDAGRVLGQVRVRVDNLEDGFAFSSDLQLKSGVLVGAHQGYDTLSAAVRDLGAVTEGHVPAAAVIERAGRFYGHQLRVNDLELGVRTLAQPLHLEADDMTAPLGLRARLRHERLRAIVDGTFVHRFRQR
jgi:hypothetical protein